MMPMARKNVEPLLPEPKGDVQRKTLGSLHKCLDGIGMLLYKPDLESGGVERDSSSGSADVRDVDEAVVGVREDHAEHLGRE